MSYYKKYSDSTTKYSDPNTRYDDFVFVQETWADKVKRQKLLDYDQSGYGDPISCLNWGKIGVICISGSSSDQAKIWVSNDGVSFVTRHTFNGKGVVNIGGPYHTIKAQQVTGKAYIVAYLDSDWQI